MRARWSGWWTRSGRRTACGPCPSTGSWHGWPGTSPRTWRPTGTSPTPVPPTAPPSRWSAASASPTAPPGRTSPTASGPRLRSWTRGWTPAATGPTSSTAPIPTSAWATASGGTTGPRCSWAESCPPAAKPQGDLETVFADAFSWNCL